MTAIFISNMSDPMEVYEIYTVPISILMHFVSVLTECGPCSHTYVTQLLGVDGGLNLNWRIHHLCKFHCVWMLPVSFLKTTRQKHLVTYEYTKTQKTCESVLLQRSILLAKTTHIFTLLKLLHSFIFRRNCLREEAPCFNVFVISFI